MNALRPALVRPDAATDTRPRVLYVIDSLKLAGGAENSLVQLVPRLQALGIETRVLALSLPDAAGVGVLRDAAIEVVVADSGRIAALRAVSAQIRQWRPNLLHTTLFEADLAGGLVAAVAGVPAVSSRVSMPYAGGTGANIAPWKRRAVRLVEQLVFARLTVATHAITHAAAQAAVADLGVAPRRITVIPRGRDRAVLGQPSPGRRARSRESLRLAADDYVILNVARQQPVKRQADLIAAFARVRATLPKARLLIAGHEGVASADLRAAVERFGLAESVRILGHRDDVPELLAAADLFAFTSAAEGLGCAILEAMAMEVPVVAYGIPAVTEVLDGHGRVVPPLDVDALAAAIIHCAGEDPAVRRARTSAALRRFEEHYTLDGVARAMADWYGDVLSQRRERA
jgi:glycosyltransferase involved in cell wall biosynthesis